MVIPEPIEKGCITMYGPETGVRWSVFAAIILMGILVVGLVTVAPISYKIDQNNVIGDSFFLKVLFIVLYMVGAVSALIGAGLIFMRQRFRWIILSALMALLGSGVLFLKFTCNTGLAVVALLIILICHERIIEDSYDNEKKGTRWRRHEYKR